MSAGVPAKKNATYTTYVDLVSQADTKLLQVNPTLAAGDVKVSVDGAALANITTLPVVTPAGGCGCLVSLTAAEMNGDDIQVVFRDAAGAEWCDQAVNIKTDTDTIGEIGADADELIASLAALIATVGAAGAGLTAAGLVNTGLDAVLDKASGCETGVTLRQALKLAADMAAGNTTYDPNTGTFITDKISDGSARVTATVDGVGNRTVTARSLT